MDAVAEKEVEVKFSKGKEIGSVDILNSEAKRLGKKKRVKTKFDRYSIAKTYKAIEKMKGE